MRMQWIRTWTAARTRSCQQGLYCARWLEISGLPWHERNGQFSAVKLGLAGNVEHELQRQCDTTLGYKPVLLNCIKDHVG
jgi:hypothetical protein